MKPTRTERAAVILAAILLTLLASIFHANGPAIAAGDHQDAIDGPVIVWKQTCPWRAVVELSQDGRDILVTCSQYR